MLCRLPVHGEWRLRESWELSPGSAQDPGCWGSVCIAALECPGGWDPSSLTRFGLLVRVPALINCCEDDSSQGCGWLETGYRKSPGCCAVNSGKATWLPSSHVCVGVLLLQFRSDSSSSVTGTQRCRRWALREWWWPFMHLTEWLFVSDDPFMCGKWPQVALEILKPLKDAAVQLSGPWHCEMGVNKIQWQTHTNKSKQYNPWL